MLPAELQAYLHQHIPVSAAMGVGVRRCDDRGVVLSAPLAANINHRATVFGGSASAVAILAAWSWLHLRLRHAAAGARLVIQRNTVDYLAPITTNFEGRCDGVPDAAFERFARTLRRHGKARLVVPAVLMCAGRRVVSFRGEYVALCDV